MDIFVATIVNAFNDDYCEHFTEAFTSESDALAYINKIYNEWCNNIRDWEGLEDDELENWLEENLTDIKPTQSDNIFFKHFIYDDGNEKIYSIMKIAL